jgi:hypothetical protein
MIVKLHKKFHDFYQYYLFGYKFYEIHYLIEFLKIKKRKPFFSLSVRPNRIGGLTLLSSLFLSSWPEPAQHKPRPKSRASLGPSLPLSSTPATARDGDGPADWSSPPTSSPMKPRTWLDSPHHTTLLGTPFLSSPDPWRARSLLQWLGNSGEVASINDNVFGEN